MRHVDEGRVHAWLDGELPGPGPDGARELERHLAACAACRARVEEERALRERAAALLRVADPGPAAPPRVTPLPVARRRPPRRVWMVAGWAASVAVAVGIGWMARPAPREQLAVDAVPVTRAEAVPAQTPAAPVASAPVAQAERVRAVPRPGADASEPAAEAASAEATSSAPTLVAPPPVAPPPPAPLQRAAAAAPARERVARRAEPAPVAQAPRERSPAAEADYVPFSRRSTDLRGTVTDPDGRPVAGAVVSVPSLAVTARTDADGSYALSVPVTRMDGADSLVVHAQRLGMEGGEQRVALGRAPSRRVDFVLEPGALALEGLVVAGAVSAEALADAAPPPAPPPPMPREPAWRTTDRDEAERQLGRRLVTAPELPVLAIELGLVEGATAVRVRQRLPGGEVLSLVQRRARRGPGQADPVASAAEGLRGSSVVLEQGDLVVEASAPLPTDSLRVLLGPARAP